MVFFSSCNSVKYHSELLNYVDLAVLDIHVSFGILPMQSAAFFDYFEWRDFHMNSDYCESVTFTLMSYIPIVWLYSVHSILFHMNNRDHSDVYRRAVCTVAKVWLFWMSNVVSLWITDITLTCTIVLYTSILWLFLVINVVFHMNNWHHSDSKTMKNCILILGLGLVLHYTHLVWYLIKLKNSYVLWWTEI